jgi:probable rRNA maturation factor
MKRPEREVILHGFPRRCEGALKKAVLAVLGEKGGRLPAEISLIMVSDSDIKKLNSKYRRVNRITDVISFRLSKKPLCGDIYISKGRSKKQAAAVGNTWEEELCYLVMHGVLHLFDYTDYSPAERKKMFAVQDKLFKGIFKK